MDEGVMTPYEKLITKSWAWVFDDELKAGRVKINADNKFESVRGINIDSPWVFTKEMREWQLNHSNFAKFDRCHTFHSYFAEKLGFINSECLKCYKVVVMPRTLKELFDLYDLQKWMKLPAKCGTESRTYTERLYGGYFYNTSLEDGKECLEKVRKAVDHRINKDIPVVLKRGCTEFEMNYGDPDNWKEPTDMQKKREVDFLEVFTEIHTIDDQIPEHFINDTKLKWILWAIENNDFSYFDYTGNVIIPSSSQKQVTNNVNYRTYGNDKT